MHVLFLGLLTTDASTTSRSLNCYEKMNEERYHKLRDIIQIYLPEDVSVGDISENSHFTNELNINSAHLVDIVLDVEDAFDIMLENEDMEQMQTVGDALDIIETKLSKK